MAPSTYPGRVPTSAYILADGEVHEVEASRFLGEVAEFGIDLSDRTAVAATGSNAAPARLAEKCGADADIPVALVPVADVAVVYSAHITRYGSIPAMYLTHGGSRSWLHVPLLDPDQLAAVDATEGSYERVRLTATVPAFLGDVWVYESWRGPLTVEGSPIRVEEIRAESQLVSLPQGRALDLVAALSGTAQGGAELSSMVASGTIDAEDVNRLLAG